MPKVEREADPREDADRDVRGTEGSGGAGGTVDGAGGPVRTEALPGGQDLTDTNRHEGSENEP